ncbi:outer membrane protein [Roseovarius aestuarii]|uniref:Outer membrane protein beta-barrel domain-containing protein n=1 Tax=Roseovarius aestuarii TaxID=475083 RepID=A0A1X7BT28_9RHOB|nr:outer membrane beta-barrel protein [Roseovarius aestuarii]SMC12768.1 hypothetical protein ROA7745_02600 [Roseovarius aestuarii]
MLTTAALVLTAAPALAGSPVAAPADAPVSPPLAASSPDWTGFHLGAQIGYADVNASPGASGDGLIGGLTGGYDWDLGDWVIGAGADYDFTDISVGSVDIESMWRLKLRGGYKLGNGLAYGTAGYAHADTDVVGDDGGYFIGAGYEHLISQHFSLGGEVIYNQISGFGPTISDLDTVTVQLRASYRF